MSQRRDQRMNHPDTAASEPERVKFSDLAKFEPKQIECLEVAKQKTFVLYGGARGGGKTYLLWWAAIWFVLRWGPKCPGVTVVVLSETYKTLRDRVIRKFLRGVPKWCGSWNGENHEWTMREEYGGGVIAFRNIDDPNNYLGVEFGAIFVDQVELHPKEVFDDLMGSLRWPGIERPLFLASANPGGIGHNWVKSYWIDRIYPPELLQVQEEFAFVRALPTDNPHLTANYWRFLKSQPERRRRAWIEGDWTVFEGQVFSEFEEQVHIIDQFTIPEDWRTSAGMDWGGKKPGWIGAASFGSDGDGVFHWEYYFREQDAFTVGYTAGMLLLREPRIPEFIQADAQMWEDGGTGAITLAEEFSRGMREAMGTLAPPLLRAPKGPNSRQVRVNVMHDYLRFERIGDTVKTWTRPKLRFVRHKVPHLIRTLPALPYDPRKPEDVNTKAEDHPYDGATYLLVSRPALPLRDPTVTVAGNRHPGFAAGGRRERHRDPNEDSAEHTNRRVRALFDTLDATEGHAGRTGFRQDGGAALREVDSIHEYL